MWSRVAPISAIALLCASCAAVIDLPAEMQRLEAVRSCCSSLRELSYRPVELGKTIDFGVTARSPAFDFRDDGLSYVAAFALPAAGTRRKLIVESDLVYDPGPRFYHFYPVATVLDAAYQPIAETTVRDLEARSSFWVESIRAIEVPLAPEARYVVIHTPHAFLTQTPPPTCTLLDYSDVAAGGIETPPRAVVCAASPVSAADGLHIRVMAAD